MSDLGVRADPGVLRRAGVGPLIDWGGEGSREKERRCRGGPGKPLTRVPLLPYFSVQTHGGECFPQYLLVIYIFFSSYKSPLNIID